MQFHQYFNKISDSKLPPIIDEASIKPQFEKLKSEFEESLQSLKKEFESKLQTQNNNIESKLLKINMQINSQKYPNLITNENANTNIDFKLMSQKKEIMSQIQFQRNDFSERFQIQQNDFASRLKSQQNNFQAQLAVKNKELENLNNKIQMVMTKLDGEVQKIQANNQGLISELHANDTKLNSYQKLFEISLQSQRNEFETKMMQNAKEYEDLRNQLLLIKQKIDSGFYEKGITQQNKLLEIISENSQSKFEAEKNELISQMNEQKTNNELQLNEQKKNYELQLEMKSKELEKVKKELLNIKKIQDKEIFDQKSVINKHIEVYNTESFQKLEPVAEIGSGSIGKVLKVISKDIDACKMIQNTNQSSQRELLNEYELINAIYHPNIVKTKAIFISDGMIPLSIIDEFVPMNLEQAINSKLLSNTEIMCIIYQIAEGMKYIQFRKIIHRNLKPSNILIAEDGTIKISDFGISKLFTVGEQLAMGNIGNQKYLAPEILNEDDEYNEKVDVYSFGVIVYALLNSGDVKSIKVRDIILGKKLEIPPAFTPFAKQLIDDCLDLNPNDRPSFQNILADLVKNDFKLVELSNSEIKDIKSFVKTHKKKVPPYIALLH